jgi:hypothetical protein
MLHRSEHIDPLTVTMVVKAAASSYSAEVKSQGSKTVIFV